MEPAAVEYSVSIHDVEIKRDPSCFETRDIVYIVSVFVVVFATTAAVALLTFVFVTVI